MAHIKSHCRAAELVHVLLKHSEALFLLGVKAIDGSLWLQGSISWF